MDMKKKDINTRIIAQNIVKKTIENVNAVIAPNKQPNLYFDLQKAIEDALRYVQVNTELNVRADVYQIIKEFDGEDGTSSN